MIIISRTQRDIDNFRNNLLLVYCEDKKAIITYFVVVYSKLSKKYPVWVSKMMLLHKGVRYALPNACWVIRMMTALSRGMLVIVVTPYKSTTDAASQLVRLIDLPTDMILSVAWSGGLHSF